MLVAALSHIHGNLPALEAVLADVRLLSAGLRGVDAGSVGEPPGPDEATSFLESARGT